VRALQLAGEELQPAAVPEEMIDADIEDQRQTDPDDGGKGGFPDDAIEPMQRLGMVYFAIVGGAAALETTQIEEIEEVAWEELMPECLWKFRVKDFGPLTVGIDAHGNSLYHDVQSAAQKKLEELYARL